MTLTREIAASPAEARSLTVEACDGARCESLAVADGSSGRLDGLVVSVTVSEASDNARTRLVVTSRLPERDASYSTLAIRVKDAAAKVVHESTANVAWVDDDDSGCHKRARDTSL